MKLNAFKNDIEKEIVNFMLSIWFHVRIGEAEKTTTYSSTVQWMWVMWPMCDNSFKK